MDIPKVVANATSAPGLASWKCTDTEKGLGEGNGAAQQAGGEEVLVSLCSRSGGVEGDFLGLGVKGGISTASISSLGVMDPTCDLSFGNPSGLRNSVYNTLHRPT